MTEPQRYSEKRLADGFDAHLLLTSPLSFTTTQFLEAMAVEFPGVADDAFIDIGTRFDTSESVSLAMFAPMGGDYGPMLMNCQKGARAPIDHYETAIQRAYGFKGARRALEKHTHYISISANSKGADLASRFRAARLVTCAAAVLAEDPGCLGVLFPAGDVLADPKAWRKGARQALKDEFPLDIWATFQVNPYQDPKSGKTFYSCGSVGVAAFNGHEIAFPAAPVQPLYAIKNVYCAAKIMLERGNEFRDSDTIGVENGDERLRIRFLPEGDNAQTDTWVILHPKCVVDEIEMFGERSRPPAPAGVDNRNFGEDNFMQKLLKRPKLF